MKMAVDCSDCEHNCTEIFEANILDWAQDNLDFRPWPCQMEPFVCRRNRKIYRFGRRCGKDTILAVEALYHLDTEKASRVMVISPYKSISVNLFEKMSNFIKSPKLLSKLYGLRGGYPKSIEFKGNGKREVGNSAVFYYEKGGLDPCGEDASLIILNEAAYLKEETIVNIVNPIILTSPKTKLIAASTPSKIKGTIFENMCSSPDYKEFHVSSTMHPDWEKIGDRIKKEFSEESYQIEILAEFPSFP
jgi:hypothetical protein